MSKLSRDDILVTTNWRQGLRVQIGERLIARAEIEEVPLRPPTPLRVGVRLRMRGAPPLPKVLAERLLRTAWDVEEIGDQLTIARVSSDRPPRKVRRLPRQRSRRVS